jgi:hypothetical protein
MQNARAFCNRAAAPPIPGRRLAGDGCLIASREKQTCQGQFWRAPADVEKRRIGARDAFYSGKRR